MVTALLILGSLINIMLFNRLRVRLATLIATALLLLRCSYLRSVTHPSLVGTPSTALSSSDRGRPIKTAEVNNRTHDDQELNRRPLPWINGSPRMWILVNPFPLCKLIRIPLLLDKSVGIWVTVTEPPQVRGEGIIGNYFSPPTACVPTDSYIYIPMQHIVCR